MVTLKRLLGGGALVSGCLVAALACSTSKGTGETPTDAGADGAAPTDSALPACGATCPQLDACPQQLDQAFLGELCAMEQDVFRSTIPCGPYVSVFFGGADN